MTNLFSYGLFWQAAIVIALRASAKRGHGSGPNPMKLKEVLRSGSTMICGGQEIWDKIAVNPAVGTIQTINWLKISKMAEDYIHEQQLLAQGLEGEIKQLQKRIADLKALEQAAQLPRDKIRELIAKGLAKFELPERAESGLHVANRTGCGHPSKKPRAPRNASRESPEIFQAVAEEAFKEGNYRFEGALFSEICEEQIRCKEGDLTCWCVQLCQRFRDIGQTISDKAVGSLGVTGSAQLIDRQQDLMSTMQYHLSEAEMCTADNQAIAAFSESLRVLKLDMVKKFEGVQDAEEALDDARLGVEEVGEKLKAEKQALDDAVEKLEAAGAAQEKATAALKAVQKDEESLQEKLANTSSSLRDARLELDNVQSCERTVTLIKSAVTTVIGKMIFHLRAEVQDPIRSLGITERFESSEYFSDPSSLGAADDVRVAVKEFYEYCAGEAKEAFDAVADEVDLSPLCTFKGEDGAALSVEDSTEGLMKAIADRAEQVKKELVELQSWLDPYKGQSLTKEKVKEFIGAGEPQGLREIFMAFRDTTFHSYLEGWMAGGPFLKLTEDLGATVESLQKMVEQFEAELEALKPDLKDAVDKREEAEQALQEALENHKEADEKHTAQQDVLKRLEADDQSLRNRLEELERLFEAAKASYQAAIDKLVQSHAEATALLQAVQDGIGGFWEQQNRADKEHVAGLETALLEAKKHHEDADFLLQSQSSHTSHRSVGRHVF